MRNKFRSDQGALLGAGLIYGYGVSASHPLSGGESNKYAIYTIEEEDLTLEDGRVLPSLYKLYIEMNDLEEQVFAKKYFLHYGQWQKVLSNKEVLARVNEWRKELIHIRRSKAIKSLEDIAFGLDEEATISHRLQALKYLVDQDFGAIKVKPVVEKVKTSNTSSTPKQPSQPLDIRINKDFERMLALTDDNTTTKN